MRGTLAPGSAGVLQVNGTPLSVDASGAWSTSVALTPGLNEIRAEYSAGMDEVTKRVRVLSAPELGRVAAVATADARTCAFLVDEHTLQVFDLASGARGVISGPMRGTGPMLAAPTALAIDLARGFAYVADFPPRILRIDLDTGDRQIVSRNDPMTAAGVSGLRVAKDGRVLVAAQGLYWLNPSSQQYAPIESGSNAYDAAWIDDPAHAIMVTASGVMTGLVAIDLGSGMSRAIAQSSGSEYNYPQGFALDPSGTVAYVSAYSASGVLRFDLRTGAYRLLTGPTVGTGPIWTHPGKLAFDATHDRLLVSNSESNAVQAVDLATGDRTFAARNTVGAGPALRSPGHVVVAPSADAALMTWHDGRAWQLVQVDLRSGERQLLGDVPGAVVAWTPDVSPRRALILDSETGSLWSVTLDGTARSLISDASHGSGPAFSHAYDLAYDAALDAAHAYVLDWQPSPEPAAIVRVELATGNRSVVSSGAIGSGPQFVQAYGFALDPVQQRAIVADRGNGRSLITVDLASGERRSLGAFTDVSADTRAEWCIAYDAVQQRALLAADGQGVWGFDLATGQRTRLAGIETVPAQQPVNGLAVWPGRGTVLLNSADELLAIDLSQGERVTVSR